MIMEVLWTYQCLNKKNKNKNKKKKNNNNNNGICVLHCVTSSKQKYKLDPPRNPGCQSNQDCETFFGSGIPINLYIYCLYLPLWTWGGRSNCLANIDFCIVFFVQAEAPKADVGGWVNIFCRLGGGGSESPSVLVVEAHQGVSVGNEIWCLIWILKPTEAPKVACFTGKHRNIKWNV